MIEASPWGPVVDQKEIAPGVHAISTTSHGGAYIDPETYVRMPESLRSFRPFAGVGWYEEDLDFAVVWAAFPESASPREVWYALKAFRTHAYYRKNGLDLEAFMRSSAGERAQAIAQQAGPLDADRPDVEAQAIAHAP